MSPKPSKRRASQGAAKRESEGLRRTERVGECDAQVSRME